MKLSILILRSPERGELYRRLYAALYSQSVFYSGEVEIITNSDPIQSIGSKRNYLLVRAKGKYTAFIDDDDRISDDYINRLMWGIKLGVDCCSLKGSYSVNGKFEGIFEHSIKYNQWQTVTGTGNYIKYERYPNHLNCIRADIAKQFKFPEINHGEDKDWSTQIHESGLLKTEHYIDSIIYYYDKRTLQPKG